MTIIEYVEQVLNLLRLENSSVEVKEEADYLFLTLSVQEEDAGKMIGNRGETLQALGHLISNSFYDELAEKRVVVDVNDYKTGREDRAVEIGLEAAQQARTEQRPIDLPPLAAYERRAVHQALSEQEGIFTRSEGEGSARRLVVYPDSYQIQD